MHLPLQPAIRLLMLVIASLGGAPLWLHHAICHHDSHCHGVHCQQLGHDPSHQPVQDADGDCPCTNTKRSPLAEDVDCGRSAPAEATKASEVPCGEAPSVGAVSAEAAKVNFTLGADSHDCWVCFQLAQAPTLAFEATAHQAKLRSTGCSLYGSPLRLSSLECPPPARGPPVIS